VVRRYWKGDDGQLAELGYRLTGSSDLYQRDGRHPSASINFVTAHDGFTLHDLVSYDHKHNEANLEDNRDGSNDNHSSNYGAEGETGDAGINQIRQRQQCNLLMTLLFSQGVPMICGGDEISRTQAGNNNAYAQDNPVSWFDWNLDDGRRALLEFTCALVKLRREHPNFHRRKFFQDRQISPGTSEREVRGHREQDVLWVRPDGQRMTGDEWQAGWVRCIGMILNGQTLDDVNSVGEPIEDDSFLLLLNPHSGPIDFYMPELHQGAAWEVYLDTSKPDLTQHRLVAIAQPYELPGYSAALLREVLD
jgi:isoamylase